MKTNGKSIQAELRAVPHIEVHARTCPDSGPNAVRIDDTHVGRLHGASPEELRLGVLVITDVHTCCAPIDASKARTINDAAWRAFASPHALRQRAVMDGENAISEKDVLSALNIKRTRFRDLIAAGVFPEPMKDGSKSARWLLSELRQRFAKHLSQR